MSLAERALRARLTALTGDPLDRAGRVKNLSDSLIGSIPPDAVRESLADVRDGDGGELREPRDPSLAPRFHSARSSCAMAINVFGPWRVTPTTFAAFGLSGFEQLRFERKCPVLGVSARRPPNLDVLAEGFSGVLAVESKLLEYLGRAKPASIEDAYDAAIDALAAPRWKAAIARLRRDPSRFRHFNASQVVKHYLGVKSCFPEARQTLVYVFWEPPDHDRSPLFALHRAEVIDFASQVSDPDVTFVHTTYAGLFDDWDRSGAGGAAHLRNLRDRYEVPIFTQS